MANISCKSTIKNNSNLHVKASFSASESKTDIGSNQSTISYNYSVDLVHDLNFSGTERTKAGYAHFYINGTEVKSVTIPLKKGGSQNIASGSSTATVTHDSDGSKTIKIKVVITSGEDPRNYDYIYNQSSNETDLDLTNIPRQATLTAAPDFNDDDNPKITYSNPAGNAVDALDACISFDGSKDDIPYRSIGKTDTSYTFKLTDSERDKLRSQAANSNDITVKFYVRTKIGDTHYYSILDKKMSITDATPTFEYADYKDTNTHVTGITKNEQCIVQKQSYLQIAIHNVKAKKNATIKKIDVLVNGRNKSLTLDCSESSVELVNIGMVDSASNVTATITVIDSRGNTASRKLPIKMEAYNHPSVIVSAVRRNNYYEETTLKATATISSLNGNNTMTMKYSYRKVGESNDIGGGILQNNQEIVLKLDINCKYSIDVDVIDKLGMVTKRVYVNKGQMIFFYDTLHNSIGINCFPTDDNDVAVNGMSILEKMNDWMPKVSNANGFIALGLSPKYVMVDAVAVSNSEGKGSYIGIPYIDMYDGYWWIKVLDINMQPVKNASLKVKTYFRVVGVMTDPDEDGQRYRGDMS